MRFSQARLLQAQEKGDFLLSLRKSRRTEKTSPDTTRSRTSLPA
jgi:hypothetical protein